MAALPAEALAEVLGESPEVALVHLDLDWKWNSAIIAWMLNIRLGGHLFLLFAFKLGTALVEFSC